MRVEKKTTTIVDHVDGRVKQTIVEEVIEVFNEEGKKLSWFDSYLSRTR